MTIHVLEYSRLNIRTECTVFIYCKQPLLKTTKDCIFGCLQKNYLISTTRKNPSNI